VDEAELVGLLHRAARAERRWAGVVAVRHVAEVEDRLHERAGERFGKVMKFLDRSDPEDWADARARFPYQDGSEHAAEPLLRPRWLLSGWELTVTGEDAEGVHVTAHSRPAATDGLRLTTAERLLDRREILVDPGRGILLRLADHFEGELCRTTELTDVTDLSAWVKAPAGDAADATGVDADEDDVDDVEDDDEDDDFEVPEAVRLAARGVGAALGGLIRLGARMQAPGRPAPDDEPWFDADADVDADAETDSGADIAGPAGRPLPTADELAVLLHRGPRGHAPLRARIEAWHDVKALTGLVADAGAHPWGFFLGPEAVWTAIGESVPATVHVSYEAVVTDLLHYRTDTPHASSPKQPTATACDGVTLYRRYPDRLVTAAASVPDFTIGRMLDPSWLLVGGETTVRGWTGYAGRPALRLTARALDPELPGPAFLAPRLDVLLDAEFGVLLRLTAYRDDVSGPSGTPIGRVELRDLRTAEPRPEDYRLSPPAGGRTVRDTGGPLGGSGLPGPLKTAAEAAGVLAGGAALLAGILGRPRKPQPPE
jgi:hypothetical protein